MRAEFSEIVEMARDRTHPKFATVPGDRFGLFRFASPTTGATLRVMVGNADLHEKLDGVLEGWDHVSVTRIDNVPTWAETCISFSASRRRKLCADSANSGRDPGRLGRVPWAPRVADRSSGAIQSGYVRIMWDLRNRL